MVKEEYALWDVNLIETCESHQPLLILIFLNLHIALNDLTKLGFKLSYP